MKLKLQNKYFLYVSLIFASTLVFLNGCANIQSPSGGPKDTTPPKLIKTSPINRQIKFENKKITLTFNKLVKLVNPQKEITVTPEMDIPPTFMDKKNSIIVQFNDQKLKPNTTYTINFGKSISDLTEGNIAEPYKYVFSTGQKIDSLSVDGVISYDIDSSQSKNVFVGIYSLSSSNVLKDSPLWFTYTDRYGKFDFANLKAGEYKIYAFTDKDNSKRFNYKKLLAFLPSNLKLTNNIKKLKLVLSKQVPDSIKIEDKTFNSPKICLVLNAYFNPKELEYDAKTDDPKQNIKLILATELPSDTICFYPNTVRFNKLEIKLGNKELSYDTATINNFNPDAKPSNIDIKDNLNGSVLTDQNLILQFSFPVKSIDGKKIILTEDNNQINDFELKKIASTNPMRYEVLYPWNKNSKYSIKIPLQAVKSIYGGENIEFKREFAISNTKNIFGSLKFNLIVPKNEQYIVYLVDGSNTIKSEKIVDASTNIEFDNILPGKYSILFVHDINKNAKWDLASFTQNRQAEPVIVYPEHIEIRANWEVNYKYDLSKASTGANKSAINQGSNKNIDNTDRASSQNNK